MMRDWQRCCLQVFGSPRVTVWRRSMSFTQALQLRFIAMCIQKGTVPRRDCFNARGNRVILRIVHGLWPMILALIGHLAPLAAQTIAADDFESYALGSQPGNAGSIDWTQTANANWLTTRCTIVNTQSQTPAQAAYSDGSSGSGLWGKFTAVTNARCELYFYDDGAAVKNQYVFMDDSSGQYGMGVAVRTNQVSGTFTRTSTTKYMLLYALANPRTLDCVVTTIDRTVGWHKVEWIRDSNNTSVALDGVTLKIVANSQMPDWASYDLGDWTWDHPVGNTGMWFDSATVKTGRTQSAYRWYQNNSAEAPTALAAQNTQTNAVPGTPYRLRLQVTNADTNTAWTGDYLRLQYREGSNGSWTSMGVGSSKWAIANGAATGGSVVSTALLTGTDIRQHHVESDTSPQILSVPATQQGEWDFPIVADATVINGVEYVFRLVVTDAAGNIQDTLTAYPALPSVIISSTAITVWQGTGGTGNGGQWSRASNWSNGVPDSAKMAVISSAAAGNPLINVATATAAGVRIENGRTLAFSVNNATLTVNGPMVIAAGGAVTQTGTSRRIVLTGATGTAFIEGTWNQGTANAAPVVVSGPTILSGTWNNTSAGSTIQLNGGLTVQIFGTLNFTGSAAMTTGGQPVVVQSGGIVSINSTGSFTNLGSLTLQSASLFEIVAAANLTLTGSFANNGSMVPRTGSANGNFNWSSATAQSLSGSGTTQAANLTNTAAGTLNLAPTGTVTLTTQLHASAGDIAISGPVTCGTLNIAASRTLTLGSGGSLTVGAAFNHTAGTVSIGGGAARFNNNYTLAGGALNVQSGGSFDVNGTATLTSGTLTTAGGSHFNFAGNFTNNAGTQSFNADSTVTFDGAAAQAIAGTGAITWGHLTVNKSAGTLSSSVAVNIGGDLTVIAGTFNAGAGALPVAGNFLMTGGTVTYTGAAFSVGGGWARDGGTLTNSNTITVNLVGANSGSFGGALATTLGGLTLNKTGGTIGFDRALDIDGAVTLTAGTVDPGNFTHAIQGNLTVAAAVGYGDADRLNVLQDGATAAVLNIATGFDLGALTIERSANATATSFSRSTVLTGGIVLTRGTLNLAPNNPNLTCASFTMNGAAAANATVMPGSGVLTLNGDWNFTQGTLAAGLNVVSAADGSINGLKAVWNNYSVNDSVTLSQNADLHTQGTFTTLGTAHYTVGDGYVLNTEGNANISGMLIFAGAGGGRWVMTTVDPTVTIADESTIWLPGANSFPASVTFNIGKLVAISLNGPLTFNGPVMVNGSGTSFADAEISVFQGLAGGSYSVVFNHNVELHYTQFLDLNNGGGTATGVELGGGATVYTTVLDHVLFLTGTSNSATSRYLTISGSGRDGATLANLGFYLNPGSPVPNTTIWRNAGTGSTAITVGVYWLSPSYIGGDGTDNDDGDGGGVNVDGNETLVGWGTAEAPTPATLHGIAARLQGGQTTIEWETSTEHRVLGYRVYGSKGGQAWQRLDAALLPAGVESAILRRYRFVTAPQALAAGDRVRLAEVTTDLQVKWVARSECVVSAAGIGGEFEWPTAWRQSARLAMRTAVNGWIRLQGHCRAEIAKQWGSAGTRQPIRVLGVGALPPNQARLARVRSVDTQDSLIAGGAQTSYAAELWNKQQQGAGAVGEPMLTAPMATGPTASVSTEPTSAPGSTAKPKTLVGEGLKITIQEDGVYVLGSEGLPPTLRRFFTPGGQRQSVLVDCDGQTGYLGYEPAGHGESKVLFYGRGYADAYGDRNVYWYGQFPNDPMKTGVMDGMLRPTAGYTLASARFEYDGFYHYNEGGNLNEPNYYDAIDYGLEENTTRSYTLSCSNRVAGTAYLRVALNSYTASAEIAPDHRLNLLVNGVLLGQTTWDGRGYRVLEVPFNAGLLANGDNTVQLQTPASVAGVPYDRSLIDWVEILYPRAYVAVEDQLTVDVWGGAVLNVTGFSQPEIRVVDLREIGRERFVPGKVYSTAGGGYGVRVQAGPVATRLYLLTAGQFKTPQSVEFKRVAAATEGTADYVVVGTPDRIAAVEPLLTLRQTEGLSLARVDPETAMDRYAYGRFGPQGVQAAVRASSPQYVLLLGDTVSDYKFQLHAPTPAGLPGIFVQNRLQGRILTDMPYGDFNGDGRLEAAVGRLPSRTPADLATTVGKIVAFTTPASDSVLLVADQVDTQFGLDFKGDLEALAAEVPLVAITRVYRQDLASNLAARTATIAGFNANPTLAVFEGHASGTAWGDARWFGNAHVPSITGATTVLAATCHTAIYFEPTASSLGQRLMASPTGAISYIGSVAAANGSKEAAYARQMSLSIFGDSATERIGDHMVSVSNALNSLDAGMRDLVHSYVLLGDPAAPIRP